MCKIVLSKIRKLPDGTKSKVIAKAHELAYDKAPKGAQYAGERILYYTDAVWKQALEHVTGEKQ